MAWQGQIGSSCVEFACPNDDCGFVAYIEYRGMSSDRMEPGYLNGDPPEECPECGADMTEVDGEDSAGPEPDPDAAHDFDR